MKAIPTARKRPQLELISFKLYGTGSGGPKYTTKLYKSRNLNFGVEIIIKNNTNKMQSVKIGGCVLDSNGNEAVKWRTKNDNNFTTIKQ